MTDRQIYTEVWYHGLLPREDIKSMLRKNGEFVVRTTEPVAGQQRQFVISVMFREDMEEQGIKHFVVKHHPENQKYSIDKYAFESVTELVNFHLKKGESITRTAEVPIKHPVPRQNWELQHEDIEILKKLGEGAFGEVSMGNFKRANGTSVKVAVKQAKLEAMTKEQIKEIMHEARLMRYFEHPNVVRFYGVAAGQEPLMVVMELASNGALDSFLKKHEQPTEKKSEMCVQAAWGLEYLHCRSVLHRDIAARNCLYGDGKVKIADFGLTREGTVYQMDPHKKAPIKWMSPETMKTAMYTQMSDVFAFGLMCWEIYNNGIEPYPGMMVAEVVQQVKAGYRMEIPYFVPPMMGAVIKKCWCERPNDRYSMADCAKYMERATGIQRPNFAAQMAEADAISRPGMPGMKEAATLKPSQEKRLSGNKAPRKGKHG